MENFRWFKSRRTICFILLLFLASMMILGSIIAFRARIPRKDFTMEPLDQSGYLREVMEPIAIVQGISWSDDGSFGILFKDSNQVEKAACLEDDIDGNRDLSFGTLKPNPQNRVEMGGVEEKAFIGLLQRWLLQDPEAQELYDLMESKSRSVFTGGETEQRRTKAMAVSMMRKLMKRNIGRKGDPGR